ncbi:hypothetical protein JB92DRAFT_2829509 [Gautieria morchelliformis]|nr:hypothetical protein JB92DRAFT_2829509 [Gautieria morchelliformis]
MFFSGNAEDAAAWLSHFKACTDDLFDDEKKIELFIPHLGKDTNTKKWWETAYRVDRTNWQAIMTAFIEWGTGPKAATDDRRPQSTNQTMKTQQMSKKKNEAHQPEHRASRNEERKSARDTGCGTREHQGSQVRDRKRARTQAQRWPRASQRDRPGDGKGERMHLHHDPASTTSMRDVGTTVPTFPFRSISALHYLPHMRHTHPELEPRHTRQTRRGQTRRTPTQTTEDVTQRRYTHSADTHPPPRCRPNKDDLRADSRDWDTNERRRATDPRERDMDARKQKPDLHTQLPLVPPAATAPSTHEPATHTNDAMQCARETTPGTRAHMTGQATQTQMQTTAAEQRDLCDHANDDPHTHSLPHAATHPPTALTMENDTPTPETAAQRNDIERRTRETMKTKGKKAEEGETREKEGNGRESMGKETTATETTKNRRTTAQMAHSPPKPHTAPSHDPTMSTCEAATHMNGEATQTREETPQGHEDTGRKSEDAGRRGEKNRSGHGRMRWNATQSTPSPSDIDDHYLDQLPILVTPPATYMGSHLSMDGRGLDTTRETHECMRSLEGGNLERELLG